MLLYSQTAQLVGIRACGKYEDILTFSQFSLIPLQSSHHFVCHERGRRRRLQTRTAKKRWSWWRWHRRCYCSRSFSRSFSRRRNKMMISSHKSSSRRSSRTVHHSRENFRVADEFQHLRQLLGVERGHREEALFTRRRFKRRILE